MFKLLGLGVLAALFFSSTFVLSRAMSLEGGHWVWSASLRYLWMIVLLAGGLLIAGRGGLLLAALRLLRQHWRFWLLAGSVGFGVFYAGIAFAASYAPSWVVATTWQLTVLASPLVLLAYGRRVPWRGVVFTLLIFAGIVLVNLGQAQAASWQAVALGALPVIVSAFAYPAGLQLVWERKLRPSALTIGAFGTPGDAAASGGSADGLAAQIIPHFGVSVGNVASYINVGGEIRAGWRLPDDFGTSSIRPGGCG